MYISPIDLLDISLIELENINEKSIIRLEKRLKILKLQNEENFYNFDQSHILINQLKNKEKRNVFIFIEKHPSFKKFLSSGIYDEPKTFLFSEEVINDYTSSLEPYLENYFIPLLKKDYQNKKYETIIQAFKSKDIFTNDLLLKCYEYIEQQTQILIETIQTAGSKELYKKCPQITYETHIDLLNSIPYGIIKDSKLEYVKVLVTHLNKISIIGSEYRKIKKAYTLFSRISIEDNDLKNQIDQLSYLDNPLLTIKKNPKHILALIVEVLIVTPLRVLLISPIKIMLFILNPKEEIKKLITFFKKKN